MRENEEQQASNLRSILFSGFEQYMLMQWACIHGTVEISALLRFTFEIHFYWQVHKCNTDVQYLQELNGTLSLNKETNC